MVLQETIKKLKSPALLQKYEKQGREQAEKEFNALLDANGMKSQMQRMVSEVKFEPIADDLQEYQDQNNGTYMQETLTRNEAPFENRNSKTKDVNTKSQRSYNRASTRFI